MATGGPPVNTAPNICTLQTLFLKNKMPLQVGASQKQQKRHIIIFSLKKCQKKMLYVIELSKNNFLIGFIH